MSLVRVPPEAAHFSLKWLSWVSYNELCCSAVGVSWSDHFMNVYRRNHVNSEDPASPKKRGSSKRKRRGSCSEGTEVESPRLGGIFRHPPTGQKRFVYLDPRQPKYGFRLEVGYKCMYTCTYMNELQCVNGTA